MGVVYKLTDEIVQFILGHREKNPLLSCRELVELVSGQFGVKLSKSSVHDTLKEHNVTSRRGRKPKGNLGLKTADGQGDENKGKFKIPSSKKAELMASLPVFVQEHQEEKKDNPPVEGPEELPVVAIQEKVETGKEIVTQPIISKRVIENFSLDAALPLLPDPVSLGPNEASKPQDLPGPIALEQEPMVAGMGAVFLKAAMWDLAPRGLLSYFVSNPEAVTPAMNDQFEAFVLGDDDVFKEGALQGWEVLQLKTNAGYEWACLKTQVVAIELFVEDGAKLYLDGRFKGLSSNVPKGIACPIEHMAMDLPDKILNNIQPLVIGHICPEEPASIFYSFVSACEGLAGQNLAKGSFIDASGQHLAEFTAIAPIKREFIIGATQTIPECADLLNGFKGEGKAVYTDGGKEIYYDEFLLMVCESVT